MLSKISSDLLHHFEAKDKAREQALSHSRRVVRLSGSAIRSIHKEEMNTAKQTISEASDLNTTIKTILKDHPDIYYGGFVESAQQELVEATVLYYIQNEKRILKPSELDVEKTAYLLGLGDVVGELRRIILDRIRSQRPYEGEELLVIMDEIYSTLMLFDFPDALHKGLRRKADVARSLVERTRGELTNAIGHARLIEQIRRLDEDITDQV
jgi:translin